MSAPSVLWLNLFFVVPTLLVVAISFHSAAPDGGIGFAASQGLLASAWKSAQATATAGAFFFAAGFFAARLSGAALPAARATIRAKASGRVVGMQQVSDRTGARV